MTDFLPVLLGSDANVYGMARSFYQQYGVTSAAICKARLVATANSKLVRIAVVEPSLEDDAVFEKTLIEFAKTNPGKPLVLVSCADGYTILLGRHREALRPGVPDALMRFSSRPASSPPQSMPPPPTGWGWG